MSNKSSFLSKFSSRISTIGKDGIFGLVRKETNAVTFEEEQFGNNVKSFAKEIESQIGKKEQSKIKEREPIRRESIKSKAISKGSYELDRRSSIKTNQSLIMLPQKKEEPRKIIVTKNDTLLKKDVAEIIKTSVSSKTTIPTKRTALSGKSGAKQKNEQEDLYRTKMSSISEQKGNIKSKIMTNMQVIPEKEEFVVRRRYVQYQPKTLRDYKRIASVEVSRGGLGPDIGGKDWQQRQEKMNRLNEYSKNVKQQVKSVERIPEPDYFEERKREELKENSKTYKRRLYAEEVERKKWGRMAEVEPEMIINDDVKRELAEMDLAELKRSFLR